MDAFLEIEFKLDKNTYKIKLIKTLSKETKLNCLYPNASAFIGAQNLSTDSINYYVDNLDMLYIYIIKELAQSGYYSPINKLERGTYTYAYRGGKCSNIKFLNMNNQLIQLISFRSKFGLDYNQNTAQDLLEYAQANNRTGCSLGADAYNEFITTVLHPARYQNYVAHQIMRAPDHYPVFEYDHILLEAKENCAGYQLCNRGMYNNLYDYDISSSYPAELLNNTPKGMPKVYTNLESVPSTYFKVIYFTYYNCSLKPNKLPFLNVGAMGTLSLTQRLFDVFREHYNATITIKKVYAFKTEKSPFDKFINKNIIQGKLHEKRPHIAKYNKLIANSIIGFFGRNTTMPENRAELTPQGMKLYTVDKNIDPIYLPVYLCVLDRAKSKFIRTVQRYRNQIVYANTDGFLSTKPLNLELLNLENSQQLGSYRQKHSFSKIYIDCINGYSAITDTGEIDNTIAGMTLTELIDPEQYKLKQFSYYINEPTATGEIRRNLIKPR